MKKIIIYLLLVIVSISLVSALRVGDQNIDYAFSSAGIQEVEVTASMQETIVTNKLDSTSNQAGVGLYHLASLTQIYFDNLPVLFNLYIKEKGIEFVWLNWTG